MTITISRRTTKVLATILGALALAVTLLGCTSDAQKSSDQTAAIRQNHNFTPPKITHFLDYHNFVKAQELYDDPTTIQWCTFTWGNANAPLVTVPVAGKLTSSTVSLRPSSQVVAYSDSGSYYPELPSSDAMYHGSPPPYRYGFTPGGNYVDFNGAVSTFCTTAMTSFQRQSTKIDLSNDTQMQSAQIKAEAALAKCNADLKAKSGGTQACPEAEAALKAGLGG